MARCFCACHSYPGTYDGEPCWSCGHFNSKGSFPGAMFQGWEPAESLEAENARLRERVAALEGALNRANVLATAVRWREKLVAADVLFGNGPDDNAASRRRGAIQRAGDDVREALVNYAAAALPPADGAGRE